MLHVCFGILPVPELLRRFSSAPPSTDVSYEQLKKLLASREAVVIDVREPWELREYGFIPGSINVPRECCPLHQNTNKLVRQCCRLVTGDEVGPLLGR